MKDYCNVCGKCMVDKDGESLIGMLVEIKNFLPEKQEFIEQQLGPRYALQPWEWVICWECFLGSLFDYRFPIHKEDK